MMRQLLQLPNHPAVLYLHVWLPLYNKGQFWETTIEDEIEVLVKYYGLQSISMRGALYDHFIANRSGFRESDLSCNVVHPNYLYHRYQPQPLLGPSLYYIREALLLSGMVPVYSPS